MSEQIKARPQFTISEFKIQTELFLKQFELALSKSNITLAPHWDLDHLCYRTQTSEEYFELKTQFLNFAKLLIESEVNGRLISTFKLNEPIVYDAWQIDLVELPAPKKGKITKSGFEHIEIVCDVPFTDLIAEYSENPTVKIDQSGLTKLYNRELEITIDDINIKFHQCSLESVVTLEANKTVWQAIQDSRVLEIFSDYDPLIAGTFPLGIANNKSDVDVLLTLKDSADINIFASFCQKHFGRFNNYCLNQHDNIDTIPTVILNFDFAGVPFEVFAQARPSVQQKAYLHYLVEERLLKYGGESFRKKVIEARNRGLKTEPAFAEVLGLTRDAYKALLEAQKYTYQQIIEACSIFRSNLAL